MKDFRKDCCLVFLKTSFVKNIFQCSCAYVQGLNFEFILQVIFKLILKKEGSKDKFEGKTSQHNCAAR